VEAEVEAMRLEQRTTIIVVVVFAVLAAFVYMVEMRTDQDTSSEEDDTTSVFSFSTGEVTLLKVTDLTSQESVTVRRGVGGAWRITDPFQADGDEERLESVLDSLSWLASTRTIEGEDVDLEAFGLAEPALRVEVGLEEGEDQVLLVGNENPAGYSRYAQREGEEGVYLASSSTMTDLEELISDPPEKPTPTPVPTETALPTVITETQTPPAGGTTTVTPTVSQGE
jgi:hypothetical protein